MSYSIPLRELRPPVRSGCGATQRGSPRPHHFGDTSGPVSNRAVRARSMNKTQVAHSAAKLGVVIVVMKHVAPIFFGDPKTAAMQVLGG